MSSPVPSLLEAFALLTNPPHPRTLERPWNERNLVLTRPPRRDIHPPHGTLQPHARKRPALASRHVLPPSGHRSWPGTPPAYPRALATAVQFLDRWRLRVSQGHAAHPDGNSDPGARTVRPLAAARPGAT